ncbi:MAG: gamma-glutamyltransferase [Nitrospirae bacterium]|nr:gamma-glutamyltransferase [Nitrospirota bacterium]
MRIRQYLALTVYLALGALLVAPTIDGASSPAVRGHGGAVASAERAATEVGLEILRAGGNAVDAAVATALALAVVHPEAGNLGGGGFAVVRMGDELASLDFREVAPAEASRDMYLDAEGRAVDDASRIGPLAAGVPGSPVGLFELHQRFGGLSWPRVVAPALLLATEGFTVTSRLHRSLVSERELLASFPETARVWLPDGRPPAIGSRMRLPALAATLEAYAEAGPRALTSGPIARAIERASDAHGGLLRASDLESYRAVWRRPLTFDAFGWKMASMDLPSSGGIILAQTFGLLESLGWREMPRFGADRAHLLAEAWRRSFADRFLMGDPMSSEADSQSLLDPEWLAYRRSTLQMDRASLSADIARWPESLPTESSDTTHIAVADSSGNLVALTTTLNDIFGCRLLVPEAGFFLNNEMDDFAAAPGRPNLYGLVQGEANAVRPGHRMLSSMSPTLGWRGSEAVVLGGRGGGRIPTAVAQVLLHLLVDGDPLQTAVDRPRLHHQWLPDILRAEADALSPETAQELSNRGHAVEVWTRDAKVNAVRRLEDGTFEAAADPRGPGSAGVVNPIQ